MPVLPAPWPPRLNAVLLGALLLAGGFYSLSLRQDTNWDLRNYHYYGPHAWLAGRLFQDVAPAQVQSFFNPLLGLPGYGLMLALQDTPRLYAFVMGLPAGLYAYLLARVAWMHAASRLGSGPSAIAAAGLAATLGATGAAFTSVVGTTTGDVLTAIPVMAAYGLVLAEALRRDAGQPIRLGRLALAGALAGAALGLKLTVVIYVVPLGMMILLTLGLRAALAAAPPMLAGFALCWGPFAWLLWQETGSPVFPLYNNIFQAPNFPPIALADERFLPRGSWQAVTYPFHWLRITNGLVTELPMRDARIAIGQVAAFGLALSLALRRGGTRGEWLLLGVAVLGHVLWLRLFGIYRYLTVMEGLAAMLLLLALIGLWRQRLLLAFAAVAIACLATTIRPNWGHARFAPRLLDVPPLGIPALALLVTTDGSPSGYLVPFLPAGVRALGLANNLIQPERESGLGRRARAILAAHDGPIVAVADPGEPPARREQVLNAYGLAGAGTCRTLRTNLDTHLLCPVQKFR